MNYLIFVILDIIFAREILFSGSSLAYGDFSSFPLTFAQGFDDFVFAWRELTFGIYRQPGLFQSLIQALFLGVFKSEILAQKAFILALPLISFTSFNYLLNKRFENTNKFAKFVAATFYSFSPIFFQEFLGGTQYTTMLSFALFPILYSLTLDFINKPNLARSLILGTIGGLIFSINPPMAIIYAISLIVPLVIDLISIKNVASVVKKWVWFLLVGIVIIFINPLLFLESFNLVSVTDGTGELTTFAQSFSKFLVDVSYTYTWSTLQTTLRLGNNKSIHDFDLSSLWNNAFYLVVALVFVTSLIGVFKKKQKTVTAAFFSYLFIVVFIYLTHLNLTDFVFLKLPVLFMFRNPAKLTYLTTFFFSIGLFYALETVFARLNRVYLALALKLAVLGLVFVYLWPLYLGDAGLKLARAGYKIPNHFYEIKEALDSNSKAEFSRNIWYPSDYETTTIKLVWIDRDHIGSLSSFGDFNGNNFSDLYANEISTSIALSDISTLEGLLKYAQIENLVILKNGQLGENYPSLEVPVFGNFDRVTSTSAYDIYQTSDVLPKFYVPDAVVKTTADETSFASVFSNLDMNTDYAVLFEKPSLVSNLQFYSQPGIDSPKNLLFEKSWSWPSVKTNPASPLYALVRLKERISLGLKSSDIQRIDTLSWFSAKRVAEIAKFKLSHEFERQLLDEFVADQKEIFRLFTKFDLAGNKGAFDFYHKNILFIERAYKVAEPQFTKEELTEFERIYAAFTEKYMSVTDRSHYFNNDLAFDLLSSGSYDVSVRGSTDLSVRASQNLIDGAPLALSYSDKPNWKQTRSYNLSTGTHSVRFGTSPQAALRNRYVLLERTFPFENVSENSSYLLSFNYSVQNFPAILDVFVELENGEAYSFHSKKIEQFQDDILCHGTGRAGECMRNFQLEMPPIHGMSKVLVLFERSEENKIGQENVTIEDLRLLPILRKELILADRAGLAPNEHLQVSFEKLNPTKYILRIPKSTTDRLVVFNDSFHPDWKIRRADSPDFITEDNHERANAYANSWLLSSDMLSEEMNTFVVEFVRQRFLDLSLLSTISTLFVVSVYLYFKRRS